MQAASNNQIKLLRKLCQRKYREQEQLFLVEGKRAVEQILENNAVEVVSVFVNTEIPVLSSSKASVFLLSPALFKKLSRTENPQGVLAICKMPKPVNMESFASSNGVLVATDAIQDPGNLGTIIRTASWFGVQGIFYGTGTVDPFNPKVIRSTAGATGILPSISGNLATLLTDLEVQGWQSFLLDGNAGATPISEVSFPEKKILVVGNETNGITNKLITPGRKRMLLPSKSGTKAVESLNAAIALSIALWSVYN